MLVRGAFNHLLRPGLRRDFRDDYQSHSPEKGDYLREGTMDRAEIDLVTLSGLHRQVVRGELESFTIMDPVMSAKITKTYTEYGNGFAVSRRMMKDDLYGKANGSSKWLGRSSFLIQEYKAAELLDDAFAGSTFTGLEGEALISATHNILNSNANFDNLIAGNPQLSILGIQAAFESGENTIDHQGDPAPVHIQKLIINISDEWKAIQITQNKDEPDTADRNINATMRKRQLSYKVSHFKDQTGKDWFAQDPSMNDAHFAFRQKPLFEDWFDKATSGAFFASSQGFLVYFYDQRGWIGSDAA